MRHQIRQVGFAIAIIGTAVVTTAAMSPADSILPESRIWVEGTSSVRSFTCEAAEVKGSVEAAVPTLDITELDGAVRKVEVVLDAAALDCGNGTMNGHMRKALKVTEHPAISFRLADYAVVAAGSQSKVRMNGTLEIAGKQQPITVEGIATAAADGAIRVQGSHAIRMTDYGVKPPSLMMGTMKVHDPVKLNFDVVLEP